MSAVLSGYCTCFCNMFINESCQLTLPTLQSYRASATTLRYISVFTWNTSIIYINKSLSITGMLGSIVVSCTNLVAKLLTQIIFITEIINSKSDDLVKSIFRCLPSQKIMTYFTRFARETTKEYNFIAVACNTNGTIATDRKDLIHMITANGWRDGSVWHATSQCASSVYEATSHVWKNTTGGEQWNSYFDYG